MRLATDDGTVRKAEAAWINDGTGTWHLVDIGWTADVNGAWRKDGDAIPPITASAAASGHLAATVSWNIGGDVPGDTPITISSGSAVVATSTGRTGTVTVTGLVPSSSHTFVVSAVVSGVTISAATALVVLDPMPAPSAVVAGGATTSSYDLSWAAVDGASSYEVCNADSGALLVSTSSLSWTRTGLTQNTAYRTYVRARYDVNVVSGPSATASISTSASFPAGTYVFKATSCDTWQATAKSWRGHSTDEVWHGDGSTYGAAGGTRTAYFFGYTESGTYKLPLVEFFKMNGSIPVNVIKLEVWAVRKDSAHGWAAQEKCRFYRHSHASKPSTPSTTGAEHNDGTLGRGDAKWIQLPTSWATELIAGTVKGIAWGGTPNESGHRYMVGPDLDARSTQMQLRITVG